MPSPSYVGAVLWSVTVHDRAALTEPLAVYLILAKHAEHAARKATTLARAQWGRNQATVTRVKRLGTIDA